MTAKRRKVYNKFSGRCAYCGLELNGKMHIDHVVDKEGFKQRIHNGTEVPDFLKHLTVEDVDHIDNLFPACANCNLYKERLSVQGFRERIADIPRQLRRINIYNIARKYGLQTEVRNDEGVIFHFQTQHIPIEGIKKLELL